MIEVRLKLTPEEANRLARMCQQIAEITDKDEVEDMVLNDYGNANWWVTLGNRIREQIPLVFFKKTS